VGTLILIHQQAPEEGIQIVQQPLCLNAVGRRKSECILLKSNIVPLAVIIGRDNKHIIGLLWTLQNDTNLAVNFWFVGHLV
jgi:hypothetical protein